VVAVSSICHWIHDPDPIAVLPGRQFIGLRAQVDPHLATDQHRGMGGVSLEAADLITQSRQYGNTKLAQVLMVFELQRRLGKGSGIT